MSNNSRFTTSRHVGQDRLTSNTVGLTTLDDFRKRRAEVLEKREREALEASQARAAAKPSTPVQETNNAEPPQKKHKTQKKPPVKLSFLSDHEDEDNDVTASLKRTSTKAATAENSTLPRDSSSTGVPVRKPKIVPNANVPLVPKALTKAALRKEAEEREELRKQFLARQARVKETEVAIPFVFYDGSDIPAGIVRVKKADHVWVFLDKSRKIGAGLGGKRALREWARVGVDDLMMVRGGLIIPHHFDFYFFVINETVGPGGGRLFDYRAEAETVLEDDEPQPGQPESAQQLAQKVIKLVSPLSSLEGFKDDPSFTKVVDRRWYERNKHIYPASTWQEFDPEKDYVSEIRRDTRGNILFHS